MFARTGRELVTSSVSDGMVTALDIDTGQQRLIGSVRPYGEPVVEHDLSPDGSSVAISYGPTNLSQKLSVRDVATGNEFFALDDNVGKVDWSPSGEYLAVAATIRLDLRPLGGHYRHPPRRRGSVRTFRPHRHVRCVQPHRGLGLATGRAHRNAPGRRRPGSLRPQRRADRHGGSGDLGCGEREAQPSAPYSLRDVTVAFSPDGTHLAVGSGDEVRVFDARSGAALQEFRHRAAFKVVFSPDGSMLASRAADGTRVWALDIDDLLEIARQNVTRSLSDEECRHYLHVAACSDA